MTTNFKDKLDEALIREGRIDFKMELKNPDKQIVEEYLSVFYEQEIILKNYSLDISMAKIQEICLQNKENVNETIKILENDKEISN